MNFEDNIKQWVSLDNNIKKLNEQTKLFRKQRNDLTTNIITYASENNMQHAVIKITNGKLKFQNTKQTQPLTLKYIKECLQDMIANEENVTQIMDHIKQKRAVKYSNDIKRYYS